MSSEPMDQFPAGSDLVYRQRRPVRLWHWINAFTVIVMLMSGLVIFNAHPQLCWGQYGANHEAFWLDAAPLMAADIWGLVPLRSRPPAFWDWSADSKSPFRRWS